MSFTIFQNEKNSYLGYKNHKVKKIIKLAFSQKGLAHGFGPKMAIFPTLFFTQYRLRKFLLRYSRTKKTPIQAIKTRSSKNHKIDIFSMVLVQKWPFFQVYFLDNIRQENVFYNILERKNAFLGVNPCFWSKNGFFYRTFFFPQYRPGKFLLRYSRTKERLPRV